MANNVKSLLWLKIDHVCASRLNILFGVPQKMWPSFLTFQFLTHDRSLSLKLCLFLDQTNRLAGFHTLQSSAFRTPYQWEYAQRFTSLHWVLYTLFKDGMPCTAHKCGDHYCQNVSKKNYMDLSATQTRSQYLHTVFSASAVFCFINLPLRHFSTTISAKPWQVRMNTFFLAEVNCRNEVILLRASRRSKIFGCILGRDGPMTTFMWWRSSKIHRKKRPHRLMFSGKVWRYFRPFLRGERRRTALYKVEAPPDLRRTPISCRL